MEYTLGQKFASPVNKQTAKVVAIRSNGEWEIAEKWQNESDLQVFVLETDRDVVLFAEDLWDNNFITDYQLNNYDEWEGDTDWTSLVTEEEAARLKGVSDKIVALLKEHNIDTDNLIVSDGKAYVGYAQCESYIADSGAWIPSSMQC